MLRSIVLFLNGTSRRYHSSVSRFPDDFPCYRPPPSSLARDIERHRILRVYTVMHQASDAVCWVVDHTKYTVYKVAFILRIGTYTCRPLLPFVAQGKILSCDSYCTSAARIYTYVRILTFPANPKTNTFFISSHRPFNGVLSMLL